MSVTFEKDITDPVYVGPGVWWIIHSKAYNAITPGTIQGFIDLMHYLSSFGIQQKLCLSLSSLILIKFYKEFF